MIYYFYTKEKEETFVQKKLAAIFCAVTLLAGLAALPAQAAGTWPDLPSAHWAYNSIVRANERGIISGSTDGTMQPDAPMTWGQYITMLSLTFQGDAYLDYPAPENQHWALPYLAAVTVAGAIPSFAPVGLDMLDQPISRQDAAALTVTLLDKGDVQSAPEPDASDFAQLPADYRPCVARSYALGLINGYEDGTFRGSEGLTRAQGVVVILNALGDSQSVPDSGSQDTTDDNDSDDWIWGWGGSYGDDPLLWPGENEAKYLRLFGSETKRRFDNKAEAEANMVTVEVPVWRLKNGVKSPGKATFKIHKALADEVVVMFTEIYNDPEQFPISSIGGYSWRGDSATGEHNCGTAIDINPTANYQVRDGKAMVGTHWTPGEDPFSMPEDGSVVRIFRAHGWDWGGDAWAWDSNPAEGYHDYMHLSYMGK